MKKFFIALIVVAVFQIVPLFAQNVPADKQSEYFYYNVPIEKVYPYRRGYVVKYRKGGAQMGTAYLPREWFDDAAGKGELIYLGSGPHWPYLAIYYRDGEFSHVRIYLRRNRSHESWGNIPLGVNLDEHFDAIDETNYRLEF
ncbi:MAG: hypothetical protein LBT39_02365 [Treponema sp.]|jgi:hypothetical protein|nr:hypothetical protein [Treponema sp.]